MRLKLGITSDIHYAGAAEKARGNDYEYRDLPNPLLRLLVRFHRRHLWLRNPLDHNYLLDVFLDSVEQADLVIANGDFSCDSAFVGVSDDAAFASASECLSKLRARAGSRFRSVLGDHELGKFSLVGKKGGMRLESFRRATEELAVSPFWQERHGDRVLIAVASSLVALASSSQEILPAEMAQWQKIREAHLGEIRQAFGRLKPTDKVLLFCHDPTALPFLLEEGAVRDRLAQVEQTIIGHLHSPFVLNQSQRLAGMPRIGFMGHTAGRLTKALREARKWKPFHVILCPSLAGIELLKDGGYYTAELPLLGEEPTRFTFHPLPRRPQS